MEYGIEQSQSGAYVESPSGNAPHGARFYPIQPIQHKARHQADSSNNQSHAEYPPYSLQKETNENDCDDDEDNPFQNREPSRFSFGIEQPRGKIPRILFCRNSRLSGIGHGCQILCADVALPAAIIDVGPSAFHGYDIDYVILR